MASTIKIKRNSTSGAVPSSLEAGELAVNLFDRKIYVGNSAGVTAIGGVDGFAADILTEIKTVDGTGSGLDADLLDGQHGSYYAVAATENSRLANTNAFIATKTTESTALSRLANTNAYIATKLDSSSYTEADVRSKAALANTNAFIATKTTESTALSRLANTNTYIATKLDSSSYTEADVRSKAALANTNAFIATKTTESTALSRLANTNSYIANVKTIATNRLGQTATIALTGDVTASATAFSSNTASLTTTIAANSVDGSQLEDNITIANNLTVSGNTHIDGNLTVEGATTYLSTSTVYTDDGMMKLNANNVADTVDSGIYNKFVESATTKYAGYFRDATDGVFKFYNSLEVEPTTTVNTGAAGYTLAQLDAVIDGGTY